MALDLVPAHNAPLVLVVFVVGIPATWLVLWLVERLTPHKRRRPPRPPH